MSNETFTFRAWLTVTALSALWLCHSGIARAQDRIQIPATVEQPTHAAPAGAYSGRVEVLEIRKVDPSRYTKSLAEIESRMPEQHIYRADSVGTWAHETTHGVNSRLRNEAGSGVGAFYCLGNVGWVLKNPTRTKLSDVARRVPQHLRGNQYNLYLVQQANTGTGWQDEPLYVLDEWVAYINGGTVLQEKYGAARSEPTNDGYSISITDSIASATEFIAYATTLLLTIQELEPEYPDMEKLQECIAYNIDRATKLTQLHPQANLQVVRQTFFQGACSGPNCGVPQWGGRQWQYSQPVQQQVARPKPQPAKPVSQPAKPVNPAPLPGPVPPGCKCGDLKPCTCDKVEIDTLKARVASIEGLVEMAQEEYASGKLKGAKGDPGPAGAVGPQGPKGEPGPPGKDATPIDAKTIAADVHKKLTLSMKTSQQGAFGRYALIAAAGAAASAGGIFALRKKK